MSDTLLVDEIFYSIQGEGPTAGRPAIFLRLAGCQLKCKFCDTDAKTHPTLYRSVNSKKMTFKEIFNEMSKFFISKDGRVVDNRVIITGGEPLIQQKKLVPFIWRLDDEISFSEKLMGPLIIEIETNGAINPTKNLVGLIDCFNVSPKLSNSGNDKKNRNAPFFFNYWKNELEYENVIFKFVISRDEDLEEVEQIIQKYDIPIEKIWLMPEGTTPEAVILGSQLLASICLEKGYNLSMRQQVILWGNQRGT